MYFTYILYVCHIFVIILNTFLRRAKELASFLVFSMLFKFMQCSAVIYPLYCLILEFSSQDNVFVSWKHVCLGDISSKQNK